MRKMSLGKKRGGRQNFRQSPCLFHRLLSLSIFLSNLLPSMCFARTPYPCNGRCALVARSRELVVTSGFLGGHYDALSAFWRHAPAAFDLRLKATSSRNGRRAQVAPEPPLVFRPQPHPSGRGWPYQGYCSAELQRAHSKWFKSV